MAGQTYTVQSGDTLSAIGARFGVPYEQIAQANNIANPNLIYPGQTFTIPGAGGTPSQTAAPAQQGQQPMQQQNTQQPAQSSTPSNNGGFTQPPYAPNVVNQTVTFGGATWKGNPGQGWTLQSDANGNPVGGTGANISGAFTANQPTIDLPGLYTSLSEKAGISGMEQELTQKQQAFNDQQSKINDNPFLSEADRVGRIQKLTTDYNNDIKNTQDALAMARQDVQTQIDLQSKQFDINSQQATQALNEFNTLLSSGALDGASGQDIANITKATGISSTMIQAAIQSQTQKDTPTSLTTVDDGTNQYAVVINTKTGAVISKQVLGASKPSASANGGNPGSAEYLSNAIATMAPQIRGKLNSYGNISPQDWNTALSAWLSAGLSQKDFVANFGQYADQNRGDFLQAYGFQNPKTAATIKSNQAVNSAP